MNQLKPTIFRTSVMRQCVTATLALSLTLVTTVAFANDGYLKAASYLPKKSNGVAGLNTRAFQNPNSVLSYIPVSEIAADLKKDPDLLGAPPATAFESILRASLDEELIPKLETMVIGVILETENLESAEYIVVSGSFTPDDWINGNGAIEFSPVAGTKLYRFENSSSREFFVAFPATGVMLLGENRDWVKDTTTPTGFGQDNNFLSKILNATPTIPDFFLATDTSLMMAASEEQPMVAMMLGPLLKAESHALMLRPSDPPTLSLNSLYPDSTVAQLGKAFYEQSIALLRQRVQTMAQQSLGSSPEIEEQIKQSVRVIESLEPKQQGRMALVELAIGNMPDRDQFREDIMKVLRDDATVESLMGLSSALGDVAP